jgi:hypothetical protein
MAQRLRWMALGGVLTLVLVAGSAFGAMHSSRAKSLGDFFFGPRLARAEVVLVQNQQVLDYRIDRGRLKSIKGANLELRELDGAVQVVPVASAARITLNGHSAPLSALQRGMLVTTVRVGTAPAQQVVAQGVRK